MTYGSLDPLTSITFRSYKEEVQTFRSYKEEDEGNDDDDDDDIVHQLHPLQGGGGERMT